MSDFSVTKVRLAFECPRLFYLTARYGGRHLFGDGAGSAGLGVTFHQLADDCVRTLLQAEALPIALEASLAPEQVAQPLQQYLYRQVFYPYLQAVMARSAAQATTLPPLWQALRQLLQRWAELLVSNRRFCPASEVMAKTFLAQELAVNHTFTLPDGQRQRVRGRCDSLIYDFALHRLCVVEYKTYSILDPTAQLVQVALYSYLLRQQVGVAIDSAVYNVLPDWQGRVYAWEQLEKSLHQLIPQKLQQMQTWLAWVALPAAPPPATVYPQLCQICPQRQRCAQVFSWEPPATPGAADAEATASDGLGSDAARETRVSGPGSRTRSGAEDLGAEPPGEDRFNLPEADSQTLLTDALADQLITILSSFGLETEYQGMAIGPAFVRIKLKPHLGVKVNSILRLSDDLRVQLGVSQSPLIAPQAGYVSVDLPRPDRQTAHFETYVRPVPGGIPTVAIGVNLENQLVEADLADPNTCHFLVGGTTGSGKSEFLRSQLLSLLTRHAPPQLKIALVDPKRVTFPEFEQLPYLYQPIVKDSDGAMALMNRLVAEMEQRYQQFEQSRCADLGQYNQQTRHPLPRIVCLFDEYADFMADKTSRQGLENGIKRLGAMARAAGIHLIIATQRPDASVVTPLIRANLPGRVALRTASEADSAIILGSKQTMASQLLGQGDLLYASAGKLQRLQSLLATSTLVRQLCS
jgi:S-DNA-T family DNA segregation ATPase FtsK/SpoIIIE